MKNNLIAAIVALSLFVSCQPPAAQSDNNKVASDFLFSLRKELMAESDVIKVNIVDLNNNVFCIQATAGNESVSAEAVCEVLVAAKEYTAANPGNLPVEYEKVLPALDAMGVTFQMIINDAYTGEKHNLHFTAKEFAGFYMLQNINNDTNVLYSLLAYLPFDRIVAMMNRSSKEGGTSFLCENSRLYIVSTLDSKDFMEMQEVYTRNPAAFIDSMREYVFSSFNSQSTSVNIIELAHRNGYKLAFKASSEGSYSSIVFDLE